MSHAPNWNLLKELRTVYLQSKKGIPTPWSLENLSAYDETFGRRILWKWQWVIKNLREMNVDLGDHLTVVDIGCGTGVATEAILSSTFGSKLSSVHLSDQSSIAVKYSKEKLQRTFPTISINSQTPEDVLPKNSVVLLSHILNELSDSALRSIMGKLQEAKAILWVEPGTRDTSRRLIEIREKLIRGSFFPVAPCPHANACGLLTAENEKHWCHFFADVPTEAFTQSFWAKFSSELSIDMRSLPVSYLVMTREKPSFQNVSQRILGRPRIHKGYGLFLTCTETGVRDEKVLKRHAPERFR